MLAAPELESTDHALAYIHRTIENLCIDLFRMEGRRPNLVVIDDAKQRLKQHIKYQEIMKRLSQQQRMP